MANESLLQQLETEGFDTTGMDEQQLLTQLNEQGFDTSQFQGTPAQPEPTLQERGVQFAKDTGAQIQEFRESPTGTALEAAATPLSPQTQEKFFNFLGEKVADDLARTGQVSPNLAALVGTVFQLAPNLGELASGGVIAKRGTQVIGKGAKELGEAFKGTGAKRASRLVEKQAAIPILRASKQTLAKQTQKEAGEAIGTAEAALGIGQGQIPGLESQIQRVASSPRNRSLFMQKAGRIVNFSDDKLKDLGPQTLQALRKTADAVIERGGKSITKNARNQLFKLKERSADAIKAVDTEFKTAMDRFKEASKVVDEIPEQFAKEARQLKLHIAQAKSLAEEQKSGLIKAGSIVLTGALFGLGAKLLSGLTGGRE